MRKPYRTVLKVVAPVLALWSAASAARASVVIYYTSPFTNGVYKTDGATNTTVVPNVPKASGIAMGPDGNLYVSEEGGNQLDRFSLDGKRVGAAFGKGRRYTSITFGSDGLLYASSETDNYATGYVRRYDPVTGNPAGSSFAATDPAQYTPTNTATYAEGIAFGPDGNLYLPGRHTASVEMYQGPTGAKPGALVRSLIGGLGVTGKATFGPDGALYVGENGMILRSTGHAFSPYATTNLVVPTGIQFGPEGDLYVSDINTRDIRRFQGPYGPNPGAFIDIFAKTPQQADDFVIVPTVPEPSALALLAPAAGLLLRRRRR